MSLKDLAAKSGVRVTPEADPASLVTKAKKAAKPKAEPQPKKSAIVRIKVDDAWIAELTRLANERFGDKEEFGRATVEFTVAKSKGRMVSMTPKLVYPDGSVKSAGAKHRIGFCTNKDFDPWCEKLGESLAHAHTAERSPSVRKPSKKWLPYAEAVGKMENPPEVKPVSGKLSIKQGDSRVTLKMTDEVVTVSSASGAIPFITSVLEAIQSVG